MEKSELLHADTLENLLKGKKSYLYGELRSLLDIAIKIVIADSPDEQENLISELEEFLR